MANMCPASTEGACVDGQTSCWGAGVRQQRQARPLSCSPDRTVQAATPTVVKDAHISRTPGPHQSALHAPCSPRTHIRARPPPPLPPRPPNQRTGWQAGLSEGTACPLPPTQRIWVTHHLDAPVPGAGGLSQTEEGNRRQVRVRDFRIGSIQGLLQAWRGRRRALGPRLLRDSGLSCWGSSGSSRGGGRWGALSHVGAEQGALGEEEGWHVAGAAWHPPAPTRGHSPDSP